MRKTLLLLIIAIVYPTACKYNTKIIARDNFEADSLSSIWRTDKFIPGALLLQSEVVRTGEKACKLTLRPGDQIEEEMGT